MTALVGFTSSFAVVLAGLKAVGATQEQAASGLFSFTLTFGLGVLWLSWRSRLPVTLAWSTPGAALLAGAGVPGGGWPAAVGAFLIAGVLIALTSPCRAPGGPRRHRHLHVAVNGVSIPSNGLLPELRWRLRSADMRLTWPH
ncbi:benzoate/H(+) symporter BenE family transporter [Arthrobacter methylotrophus]|uniref:Benzoate/H(+) symporter BenE family transporter n=1 Tax=Arthrobacter methylotrophus TaxID=121291 RepID=A0ABV5UTB5_9MICC